MEPALPAVRLHQGADQIIVKLERHPTSAMNRGAEA
jgi:hypothetical protein